MGQECAQVWTSSSHGTRGKFVVLGVSEEEGRVHDLSSTRNVAETKGVTVLSLGHVLLESLGRKFRWNKRR